MHAAALEALAKPHQHFGLNLQFVAHCKSTAQQCAYALLSKRNDAHSFYTLQVSVGSYELPAYKLFKRAAGMRVTAVHDQTLEDICVIMCDADLFKLRIQGLKRDLEARLQSEWNTAEFERYQAHREFMGLQRLGPGEKRSVWDEEMRLAYRDRYGPTAYAAQRAIDLAEKKQKQEEIGKEAELIVRASRKCDRVKVKTLRTIRYSFHFLDANVIEKLLDVVFTSWERQASDTQVVYVTDMSIGKVVYTTDPDVRQLPAKTRFADGTTFLQQAVFTGDMGAIRYALQTTIDAEPATETQPPVLFDLAKALLEASIEYTHSYSMTSNITYSVLSALWLNCTFMLRDGKVDLEWRYDGRTLVEYILYLKSQLPFDASDLEPSTYFLV